MARRDPKRLDEDVPMFDIEVSSGGSERQRRPKSIGRGWCPEHVPGKTTTPLDRQGEHAVWRPHYITTMSGAALPCRASGIALCVAPARIDHTGAGIQPECACAMKGESWENHTGKARD